MVPNKLLFASFSLLRFCHYLVGKLNHSLYRYWNCGPPGRYLEVMENTLPSSRFVQAVLFLTSEMTPVGVIYLGMNCLPKFCDKSPLHTTFFLLLHYNLICRLIYVYFFHSIISSEEIVYAHMKPFT